MVSQKTLNKNLDKKALREVEEYSKALKNGGIKVVKLILFGSYAKGLNKPWSDVDLGVVSPDFGKNYFDELVKLQQLRSDKTLLIDPHPFNPSDLTDRWNPLVCEVIATGVKLDY